MFLLEGLIFKLIEVLFHYYFPDPSIFVNADPDPAVFKVNPDLAYKSL